MSNRIIKALFALACCSLLGACALTRSEITLPSQVSAQPTSGIAVVVSMPVDARKFEAEPRDPSVPSLKDPAQIADPQVTSRAIGRKRNGFGAAIGEMALAPPQTVASVVADAVKAGLRDSGYRVIEAGESEYATAPKINIQISEYWTWIVLGFTAVKLDHEANITLGGNLPQLRNPVPITARETKSFMMILESDWPPLYNAGLAQIRNQVRSLMSPRMSLAPTYNSTQGM